MFACVCARVRVYVGVGVSVCCDNTTHSIACHENAKRDVPLHTFALSHSRRPITASTIKSSKHRLCLYPVVRSSRGFTTLSISLFYLSHPSLSLSLSSFSVSLSCLSLCVSSSLTRVLTHIRFVNGESFATAQQYLPALKGSQLVVADAKNSAR